MPRAEKTADRLVETAVAIVDEGGPQAPTRAAVVRALGIRTPSRYHHVEGVEGLRREVRRVGLERLGDDLQRASSGLAGRAALEGAARVRARGPRRAPRHPLSSQRPARLRRARSDGGFAMPLERETSFDHVLEALDARIERLAHGHHTQGRHRA